jgi:hypothetical protein
MKMRLAASFMLVFVLASAPASAEKKPGDQLPLYQPACGEIVEHSFRLQDDLNCSAYGNAVRIGRNGITIDLNNNTVSGGLEDNGIWAVGEPQSSKTVIRNGVVRGFQNGLVLGRGSTVLDVVVVDNEFGILSAEGLTVRRSSIVANNVGYAGGPQSGVLLEANRFSANDKAVVIDLGSHIPLEPTATQIRKNTIAGNFEHGILIENGTQHVIADNVVSGNGHSGEGNGFPGIELDPQATYVKTTDNRIDANGDDGYRDDGANNTASRNQARGNGFYDVDGAATGIEAGSNPAGSKNNSLGNDATVQCTTASMCVLPQTSSSLPLRAPACGTSVTASFRLAGDITCPGRWITVEADNVTIDLNRHTVRGPGRDAELAEPAIGIRTVRSGTTVKNGVIRGFSGAGLFSGVATGSPKNLRATDLVLVANLAGTDLNQPKGKDGLIRGIVAAGNWWGVELSVPHTLSGSTLAGNLSNGLLALSMLSEQLPDLIVEGNLVAANAGPGIYLGDDGSDDPEVLRPTVTGNKIVGNGHGFRGGYAGLVIDAAVNEARLTHNVAEGNGGQGLAVSGEASTVKLNDVRGNGYHLGIADDSAIGLDASTDTAVQGSGNESQGNDAGDQCEPNFLCPAQ